MFASSLALVRIVWVPSERVGVVKVKETLLAGVKGSTFLQASPSTLYSMSTTSLISSVAEPE